MTSQPLSVPTRPEYSPNEEGIDSDKEESPLEGNVNLQEAQASLNIISSADAMNRLSK